MEVAAVPFPGTLSVVPSDRLSVYVPDGGDGEVVNPHPGAVRAGRERFPIRYPEICVVPRMRPCQFHMDTTESLVLFSLDPAFCDEQAMKQCGMKLHIDEYFVTNDPFVRGLGNTLAVAFRQNKVPDEGFLFPLARELARHVAVTYGRPERTGNRRGLSPARLSSVLTAIDERLGGTLTNMLLAQHVNMSEFHFCRMFQASTGYSPHAYVTLRRMDRARQLLQERNCSLRNVASAVGYKTQAHFTSVFHAYCGMTPAAYRRSRAATFQHAPPT